MLVAGLRSVLVAVLLALVALMTVGSAPAAFASLGLNNFNVTFTNEDGSVASQAGSHPFAMTTSFGINYSGEGPNARAEGQLKDVFFTQIAGIAGNTTVYPQCSTADFLELVNNHPNCSDDTAVGVAAAAVVEPQNWSAEGVYNLKPPPGVLVRLGFRAIVENIIVDITLEHHAPYAPVAVARNIPEIGYVFANRFVLWGNPSDPAHDRFRGSCYRQVNQVAPGEEFQFEPSSESCSVAPRSSFLTVPTRCAGANVTSFAADDFEEPGALLFDGEPDLADPAWVGGGFESPAFTGCERLVFKPSVSAVPTSELAQSPTGLDFNLGFDDEGLTSAEGLAQSQIKKAVVVLPEGMTANPAVASGLAGCSEAQLAEEGPSFVAGQGCPPAAKVGSIQVESPLVSEPLEGELFMASPYANPFHTLLAMYFVIRNPKLGIVITQPAEIAPDPITGRLTTTVDEIPQLPFSSFDLHFRAGARTPLVTPSACGSYQVLAQLTPWSDPQDPLSVTSSFQVTHGVGGGPCPSGGVPPFKPGFVAGTDNNAAGSYSPFYLRVERQDGEQEITGLSTTMPPGLTGNLNGIPFCSEADIQHAREQSGAQAETGPACPAASEIGHTVAEAGVGPVLAQTPGELYLAGPFEGAPFSVVSITSAKVGPFDLGTVVVHLPLQIDPTTAQVSIPSGPADQIPHIIKGIVIHLRSIRIYIDREHFMINPTSCDPSTLTGTIIGSGANFASAADDVPVAVPERVQAADCSSLAFKPAFAASTTSHTSKANGASLHVNLTYPTGALGKDANIKQVKVELPRQLPSRLTTLQKACTAAQFHTNPAGCPAASVVGHAKAITPILPVPLEGPAYFVSNGGEAFPNLIMVLQGYGVTIDLVGETYISKTGVTSSTFKTVPDQPVQSFELTLPQGPYSALGANTNLCAQPLLLPTEFVAQNGAQVKQNTPIEVQGCSNTLRITGHKLNKQTLTLNVYVPGAGKLHANAQGLRPSSKKSAARGTITLELHVKLTKHQQAILRRHHRHRIPTHVKLTFKPTKGKKLTKTVTVKI